MHNIYRRKNIGQLIVGTFFMAIAYGTIYDSAGMVTGGFSGIGIIIGSFWNIPLWLTNLTLNIPLFLLGWKVYGRKFLGRSFLGAVLLTVFLGIVPTIHFQKTDYLLIAIFGGAVCGVGIGLVLRSGATTGGTDLLSSIIHKKIKHFSVVQIMQILDGLIILMGIAVFGVYTSLYAIIAVYVTTLVSDGVMEGAKHARAVYIISDQWEQLSKDILMEMGRGVTYLYGQGVYSLQEKRIVLCVVSKKQIPYIKEIVSDRDPSAFCFIGDVREVLGEGFVQNIQ